MSLGSTEAIKRAVMSGVGVAVVSRLAVSMEVEAKKLVILHVRDLSLRRPLHKVLLKASHQSKSLEAFVAVLNSIARHH